MSAKFPSLPDPAHADLDSMLSRKFGREVANYFSGSPLNRVSFLRGDHKFLSEALHHPTTRFILFNNLAPLVHSPSRLAYVPFADVKPLVGENPFSKDEKTMIDEYDSAVTIPQMIFLGLDARSREGGEPLTWKDHKGAPTWAVDVTPKGTISSAAESLIKAVESKGLTFQEGRMILSLPAEEGAIYAQGRALIDWNARNPFCGGCGQPTLSINAGGKRVCPPKDLSSLKGAQGATAGQKPASATERPPCATRQGISNLSFPRTDPTAIMAVVSHDGQKILLGRQKRWPPHWYSTLAGFLEPAESIEEAVRREVWEEAGVHLGRVVIHSSQVWPYPANLMIGAVGQTVPESETIDLGNDPELEDAKWFTFDEVREALQNGVSGLGEDAPAGYKEGNLRLPPPTAIAHQLIPRSKFSLRAICSKVGATVTSLEVLNSIFSSIFLSIPSAMMGGAMGEYLLRVYEHRRCKKPAMLLEDQRNLHEDLERLEAAISDRILEEPRNNREQLTRDHEISEFLDLIQERSSRLLNIYEDSDGQREGEIQAISTGDPFDAFSKQLGEIKEYHRQYPNEPVENLEKAYSRKRAQLMTSGEDGSAPVPVLTEIDRMFTGEEAYGRYFDLNVLHETYVNLPGSRHITYIQYLDQFDIFTPPKCPIRRGDKLSDGYFRYVGELDSYLSSFMRRTRPLEDLDKLFASFDREFDEEWQADKVPGWSSKAPADTASSAPVTQGTGEGIWCADCEKEFKNDNVYKAHLTGKKHIKAAELRKSGADNNGVNGHGNSANRLKERAVAEREHRIRKLAAAMKSQRDDTRVNTERRQGMTERERQLEIEALYAESIQQSGQPRGGDGESDDDDDEEKIYNPLKLPLAWDGKPIPFWLYKLHGLGVEFPCEICGNFVYMGRRAFDKHFNEARHIYGLKCLGITATSMFREITSIDDAQKLWAKLQRDQKKEKSSNENVVQMEDSEGNVMPEKVYYDLQKQGLGSLCKFMKSGWSLLHNQPAMRLYALIVDYKRPPAVTRPVLQGPSDVVNMKATTLLGAASLFSLGFSAPLEEPSLIEKRAAAGLLGSSPYTPLTAQTCPAGNLIRQAKGLAPKEAAYIQARNKLASASLAKWLQSTGAGFNTTGKMPTLAMSFSGGGLRAQLVGAGVRQAIDGRDSKLKIAGLYQAATYESGLSGGSWLLGSISGNDYPTVSHLRDSLWEQTIQDGLLLPDNFLALYSDLVITGDIADKQAAGFQTTIVDFWGRLQGYTFLPGKDGGVAHLFSEVASSANFTAHNVPFPIITALGVAEDATMCEAVLNSTQFEITPYEFGSWDASVHAFTPTAYLGTTLTNGQPATRKACVTRYDNLAFIMGTSSNVFPAGLCPLIDAPSAANISAIAPPLASLLGDIHAVGARDVQALYPNPFYRLTGAAPRYAAARTLALADGGTGGQNNPVWPLLHRPAVDVLLVSDNSADTAANYPDGRELRQTYVAARAAGLTRMPPIPEAAVFVARGLDKRPAFFGCNSPAALTIVWLPNTNYTFNSGQSTFRLQYSSGDVAAMIANGRAVADYGGKAGWATCVGCAVTKKSGAKLPAACAACFKEYCYN
ncbi:hypothetical protein FH972_024631 [Carpinus fangiana]|uniref:Uncharacterized protein n=1 Tax=Carpinus fangiana TaxID=176857 RepID=A0A5N6KYJ6_9ROSI|nr:hypothetical protein FH972_024631 [Carpinus fangiana]